MDNEELLQAIREIVKNEVREIVKDELKEVKKDIRDLQNDMFSTKNNVVNIGIRMISLEGDVKTIERKVTKIEAEAEQIKAEVTQTNLIIENEITPSIKFIAEGHKGLADRLGRIEDKQDEMGRTVLALDIVHMKR